MFGRKLAAFKLLMEQQRDATKQTLEIVRQVQENQRRAQKDFFDLVAQMQVIRVAFADLVGECAALQGGEETIDAVFRRAKSASLGHFEDSDKAKEMYLDIILHLEREAKGRLRARREQR